jgi:hypothetical protein
MAGESLSTMPLRKFRFVLSVCLALVIAVQASAQLGGRTRRDSDSGGRRDDAGKVPSEITRLSANDRIRLQLSRTRLALNLKSDQASLWQSYEDKAIALLEDSAHAASWSDSESGPKQVEQRVATLRARLEAFERLADTANKLYSAFSEDQKKVADKMLPATVPAPYPGAPR